MPTSATGADRRQAGFTLVELMVVLALIGLGTALVAVSAPPRGRSLAAEAEQFGARLVRAREEAVLSNRPIAVEITPAGYLFRIRINGRWDALHARAFAPGRWGEGVTAALPDGAESALGAFDVTGVAEPVSLELSRDARRVRVSVDAAGNVRIDAPA